MSSVNKVILVGYLGRDPEIRSMQNGSQVCNFSVATSESWKDKTTGERREKTEWHNIVVFNDGLIENLIKHYLQKGSRLYVEGKLQTRKWTDQQGQDRYSTEVVLQNFRGEIVLLGNSASSGGQSSGGQSSGESSQNRGDDLDDEIPF